MIWCLESEIVMDLLWPLDVWHGTGSEMWSFPLWLPVLAPPGLPGTVHCTWHCTQQYRSLYSSSVSKKRSSDLAASSKHPPLVSNLSVTENTGFDLARHKLWCTCQGTVWASRGLALQVPGSASLNMWLLTRCSINTGRETSHDVDIWIILRFVCATQISCYYRSSLLFLGHIMNNESIHFSARQFKMFPSSRNIKCFMKWKKVTKISQVVLIIFVRLLKSFYK